MTTKATATPMVIARSDSSSVWPLDLLGATEGAVSEVGLEHEVLHGGGDGERSQAQVEAAQPKSWHSDQDADGPGDEEGQHDRPEVDPVHDPGGDQAADADERQLAQRDVAAVAGEQHEREHDQRQAQRLPEP